MMVAGKVLCRDAKLKNAGVQVGPASVRACWKLFVPLAEVATLRRCNCGLQLCRRQARNLRHQGRIASSRPLSALDSWQRRSAPGRIAAASGTDTGTSTTSTVPGDLVRAVSTEEAAALPVGDCTPIFAARGLQDPAPSPQLLESAKRMRHAGPHGLKRPGKVLQR